jgi:hypothetical protein
MDRREEVLTVRLTISLLLTWLVFPQLSFASDAPAGASTRPDLSTPVSAVVAFLQASSGGDEEAAREAAVVDDATGRLLDACFLADRAHRDFVGAAISRFGEAAKGKLDGDSYAFLVQMARGGKVTIHGETADIGDDGNFPCRRIDGQWRYDLIRLHAHDPIDKTIGYEKQIGEYDKTFAKDIADGKYASLEKMMKAYDAGAPQPPPPAGM